MAYAWMGSRDYDGAFVWTSISPAQALTVTANTILRVTVPAFPNPYVTAARDLPQPPGRVCAVRHPPVDLEPLSYRP